MDNSELMAIARDVENIAISPEDILLTGKVAVVTGGGGGIGQGIALGLARFGADVAVLDVVPERCTATRAAIEKLGRRAIGIPVDVMDPVALHAAIERARTELGRIDILINNAGGTRSGPFISQPEASIRRHIEINLTSTILATQQAAAAMIEQGDGGSIVNVASIEAIRAAPNFAVYAACKAGMVSFTKSMSVELAEHGIRVNAIAPDHTISPGERGNRSGPVEPESWPATDDSWARVVPLGREGLVEECASTVVWLCSKMSDYVTGINVSVDGGTAAAGGWLRGPKGWTLNP
jgi:NAD(P)-dependent dehydrogenase (short-subunit alcohol dehydrogenase family)